MKKKIKLCDDIMDLSEEIGRDAWDLQNCIKNEIDTSFWRKQLERDRDKLDKLLARLR